MSLELKKQYKIVDAYSIVRHLRGLYNEHARTEFNMLFSSKMEGGTSSMQHALKLYEIKAMDETKTQRENTRKNGKEWKEG